MKKKNTLRPRIGELFCFEKRLPTTETFSTITCTGDQDCFFFFKNGPNIQAQVENNTKFHADKASG